MPSGGATAAVRGDDAQDEAGAPTPALVLAAPPADEAITRVLEAAVRCVARWGMAKTSIEDIAREAGVSRATLYRLVPGGRDALFDRAVDAELTRLATVLSRDLAAAPDLRELLVTGVQQASRAIRDHDALQYLLAHEPELVLPHLAFDALDPLLASVSGFVAPFVAHRLPADAPAELGGEVGEWLARLVVGCALDPAGDEDLTRRHLAERVVDTFVLPGIELAVADARDAARARARTGDVAPQRAAHRSETARDPTLLADRPGAEETRTDTTHPDTDRIPPDSEPVSTNRSPT